MWQFYNSQVLCRHYRPHQGSLIGRLVIEGSISLNVMDILMRNTLLSSLQKNGQLDKNLLTASHLILRIEFTF